MVYYLSTTPSKAPAKITRANGAGNGHTGHEQ
jgi:hypothetical protein